MKSSKALFLDRDGTILKEVPGTDADNPDLLGYLTKVEQVELIENAGPAISKARKLGYKTIIITNQSAFARGLLTEVGFEKINQKMYRLLKEADPGAIIDDLFYCPYFKEGIIEKYRKDTSYRKPGIGMIKAAEEKYNIDLPVSYFIGDSYTDMKTGVNAGTKNILVLTGYGKIAYKKCLDEKLKIDFIADNILEAVKYIEKNDLS